MKPIFKPYRLINRSELNALQQTVEQKLQVWNDAHALFPLSCTLTLIKPKPAAICDLSIIKHSLFGDQSDCFNTLTQMLFNELLTQLPGIQSIPLQEDWFYKGSPSLTLTLINACGSMPLYLDSQWVLKNLPTCQSSTIPPVRLHEALASQDVVLHIELNPLPLKLADILRLQIGDVIKTDHPTTEPVKLTHQQQDICTVDIGESNQYKSIQITRSS